VSICFAGKGGIVKADRSKNINVRISAPIRQRIEALIEARREAGDDEATLSTMVRKLIKIGLVEMETR